MNKKILFLLGDIWDMKKNQGMPSVFKILEATQMKYSVDIYTTDKDSYEKELPNAEIFYFKKTNIKHKNRYIEYFFNRFNNIILNIQYVIKFIKNQKQYDILYCSSSFPIIATIFLKKIYKIKTIHRIYGTFLYENLNSRLDKIKKFEEVLLFKSRADKYIITDDGTRGDVVAKYFEISNNKIVFLKNGVDIYNLNKSKNELREELNLEKDIFYFLTVSRLVGWKRVDRVIKAMNLIENENIKLLVIGDGEEKDNLQSLSKNKNVKFIGSVSREDVHKYMNAIDVFVSMYDLSNVGNPLLEALSYGLPIITYDSGNTKEIIDGNNGILISKNNSEDEIINNLLKQMTELYHNKELKEQLSHNALIYSNNYLYSWDKRIDIEVKIIEELLNE